MDNIAHSLAGFALGRAGLDKTTPGGTLALVLASNLPDIDILFRLGGAVRYLEQHRGWSHSIVGAPLLALALTVVLHRLVSGARFGALLVCALVGVAGHAFMDLWTTYGTRVLLPFDGGWYAWDLVFIIDPFVWALLLASVLLWRRSPLSSGIATVGIGLLLAYVGGRAVLHAQAIDLARAMVPRPAARIAALPSPVDPFRWKVIADTEEAYWSGEVHLRRAVTPRLERREKRPDDGAIALVRAESDIAAVFLAFSRFPFLEVVDSEEGRTLTWRDLRFEDVPGLIGREDAIALRRREAFIARVVLGPDGRLLSQSLRF